MPYPSSTGGTVIRFARINATDDGDNTVITAKTGVRYLILGYAVTANAAGVVTFQSSDASPQVYASFELTDSGSHSYAGGFESPAFEVGEGDALEVNNAAGVDTLGHVSYVEF